MKAENTALPGVLTVTPRVFEDDRGYFFESYRKHRFEEHGIPFEFVQDNDAKSEKGVLRGLLYQLRQPQGKLVRVVSSSILDVAVDIRKMLYIPEGFAHGYLVTSNVAIVTYKCTAGYAPDDQYGIIWNDPSLNIIWGTENPSLAERDQKWPTLQQQTNLPVYS